MDKVVEIPTRSEGTRGSGWKLALRSPIAVPALVGAVGAALMALASDLPGSPYGPRAAGLWPWAATGQATRWEGPAVPHWVTVSDQAASVGDAKLAVTLAVMAGFSLLGYAWSLVWRRARADRQLDLRKIWLVMGCWTAPLLFAAPFATQDAWTYGTEGNLVLKGVGGYRSAALLKDSVWSLGVNGHAVHPSPYGPGALDLSAFFVWISGGHPWMAAECWRIAAIVGGVLCAWGVHRIVTIHGGNPMTATLVAAANPATLIIFVAGMHNDALMLGLMVAGIALAVSGRRYPGIVLCVLAMAVKPNALLAVGAVSWWVWGTHWRDRLKGTVTAAAAAVGVLFVSGLGVGGGFGWITSALSYGSVPGPWSLGTRFLGVKSGWPVTAIEAGGLALAVALILVGGRSGRWITGLGWAFAVLALTIPRPEPWYLAWAVALLACGGLDRQTERGAVAIFLMMMTGSVLPLGPVWWFGGVILLVWLFAVSLRWGANPIPPEMAKDDALDRGANNDRASALALTGQRGNSLT